MTVFDLTPRMRAIWKSSAAARIWTPIRVRCRKSPSATSSTRVTPIVTMSSFGMDTEPICTDSDSQVETLVPCGAEPSIRIARFCNP